MAPAALEGTCLCGNVSYTSTCLPSSFSLCHCRSCRRNTGSAFGAWADLPKSSVKINSSHAQLLQKSSLAVRSSCSQCGTPLFMEYHATGDTISVAAGTIDEGRVVGKLAGPSSHIFVAEKAAWFTIPDDGLRRYDRFPDDFQEAIDAWKAGRT